MCKYTLAAILFLLCACGEDQGFPAGICVRGETAENGCGTCSCSGGQWDCPRETCPDLGFKAGFIEIEPIQFALHSDSDTLQLTSSPTRMWTIFQPAEQDPANAPLVVLFNGGPGATTTGLLFAYNTATKSLDPDLNGGVSVGDNPHTWTRLANLLYIDARLTGFSYGLMNEPSNPAARHAEFSVRNFNCFLDGADFVRVILRFLDGHPAIKSNPVFIAGESYGGVRSTVILHLFLNYAEYASDESVYQDTALADEIQAHLEWMHPEYAGMTVPPEIVAGQFSRQILIQPLLSGRNESMARGQIWEQPCSVIHKIAEEEGLTFLPCQEQDPDCRPVSNALDFVFDQANRDVYNYVEPGDWTLDKAEPATNSLMFSEHLSEATGVHISTIGPLTAEGRTGAYRIGDPAQLALPYPPSGNLGDKLGLLSDGDTYFLFTNSFVLQGFYSDEAFELGIDPFSLHFGEMFLQNLAHVETFVTHAAHDLMTYSASQPLALSMHTDILAGCQHDEDARPEIERAGWMHLEYLPGALGIEGLDHRTIRFPFYAHSGHVITFSQPAELLDDVIAWLANEN